MIHPLTGEWKREIEEEGNEAPSLKMVVVGTVYVVGVVAILWVFVTGATLIY